jgi:hypothetical protein
VALARAHLRASTSKQDARAPVHRWRHLLRAWPHDHGLLRREREGRETGASRAENHLTCVLDSDATRGSSI